MQTTQLIFNVDFDKLNERYLFLKLTNQSQDKKSYWSFIKQLDKILDNVVILASSYRKDDDTNIAYLLLDKTKITDDDLFIQSLRENIEFSYIKVNKLLAIHQPELIHNNGIYGVHLYQLLFNAIANSKLARHQFNNIGGQLIVLPSVIKKNAKIITPFHLTLTKELVLTIQTTTYQRLDFIKKNEKDKTKLAKILLKPAYQLSPKTLKLDLENQNSSYIKLGQKNSKSVTPALSIKSYDDLINSRLYILQQTLERFNEFFNSICQCQWQKRVVDKLLIDRFRLLKDSNALSKLVKQKDIRLVDKINDEHSKKLIDDIHKNLENLPLNIKIGKRESKNGWNLCLIKSESQYQNDDPYRQDFAYIRQHLTDELYQSAISNHSQKVLLQNLLKELWIKQHINDKKLTLFDNYHLIGKWVFGKIVNNEYYFLELAQNGDYVFYHHDDSILFQHHSYEQQIHLIQEFNKPYENNKVSPIELFIISPDNDINIILNQQECVMPNMPYIKEQIIEKEKPLPNHYQNPVNLIKLLDNQLTNKNEKYQALKMALLDTDFPLEKDKFRNMLNQYCGKNSEISNAIREILKNNGIVLHFSKSKNDLLTHLPELFTIQAGAIDDNTAWYGIGYYFSSLQQELPHLLHIRKIIALSGKLKHQEFIELMDIDIVRYGQFTVLPYIHKYLNEIINIHQRLNTHS